MLVVADTSPLRYLVLIGHVLVLPVLFERLLIPLAWLDLRAPTAPLLDAALRLGVGEREALSLAQECRTDLVLLEDLEAREEVARHGLAVMGTLRVLELAAERGLLDLPAQSPGYRKRRSISPPSLCRRCWPAMRPETTDVSAHQAYFHLQNRTLDARPSHFPGLSPIRISQHSCM